MDVPPLEQSETETYPLLMERSENLNNSEHTVDISDTVDTSSSSLAHGRLYTGSNASQIEDWSSSITRVPTSQPSVLSNGSNSRNSSFIRRGDTRRRRSPLNSRLWISIEFVITLSQIVAAVIVLSISRQEHPRAPLFEWIVGYASGCVATLPLLYWRYRHHNQTSEQDSSQSRQSSSQVSLSVSRTSEGEDRQTIVSPPRSNQGSGVLSLRLKIWVEYFKMGLDCFFAVCFVVGNVWIFGGHSSASESPNLYRLCIVFLTFSCIGYAMPFILCVTICCCLPCIISILGFREDLSQIRGATVESINSLPTYKFKMKRSRSVDESSLGVFEGGVVAAGTDKERMISGEDAVCCICLAKYANNDELRELPCSHFFHKDCVDKWLKINALCPLCKKAVGESMLHPRDGSSTNHQRGGESRVGRLVEHIRQMMGAG